MREYKADIQPDDNPGGSFWEITCQTELTTHLIAEELSEWIAKRIEQGLQAMEEWERKHAVPRS